MSFWRWCGAGRESRRLLPVILLLLIVPGVLSACGVLSDQSDGPPPTLISEPPSVSAFSSLEALQEATIPPRDLVDLTKRLRGISDVPQLAQTANYRLGDVAPFWYKDHTSDETVQVNARLAYRSDLLNLWLEEGQTVDEATLQRAAAHLETAILPTNRAFFGEEWRPGIDGDSRLNILHLKEIGGNAVGYFSAADEFVTLVNPYSNQRELFYVSLEHAPVASDDYYEVIAHEMQHMIHWHTDSNEATWLDEGLAVLAATLNGYDLVEFNKAYAAVPDVQLTYFDYESEEALAHYGASYLFAAYFLDRFGDNALRTLVQNPANGIQGVTATLDILGQPSSFDQFFAEWLVATYLDGQGRGEGIYQYKRMEVPPVEPPVRFDRFPADELSQVHQYGADLVELESEQPLTLIFTGTRQISLLPTMPHSGSYFWSTVPGDDSDMTLTGQFDLSGLDSATLHFWTWYEIEENWDYAYLMVSTDEGASWQLLETEAMTRDDPQGNSFGPALTGNSGGGEEPVWVEQQVDLSDFVGGPILLRFEYVTDDAVHRAGLALDDISIPELGYTDDVEVKTDVWQGAGFVRHSNRLPQSFLIQVVVVGDEGVRVQRLPLNENQQGEWKIALDNQYDKAILIISGTTPVTTLPASYSYLIQE